MDTTNTIESHTKLYMEKVDDFCKTQQHLLNYLALYSDIKVGSLSDFEIDALYEEMNSDDEYEDYYDHEEHGSKIKFLEYESLRLLSCYKKSLLGSVTVSIRRLDNLLSILIEENKDV